MSKQFSWETDYSVNVKVLDEQHKKLVEFMNNLYENLLKGISAEQIETSFNEIMALASEHFSTEERYFQQYAYPGAEEHIQHHREIVADIEEIRSNHKQDIVAQGFQLLDLMEDWLIVHMNTMDKKYSFWFNEHGLF